jgi:hypothetical protein
LIGVERLDPAVAEPALPFGRPQPARDQAREDAMDAQDTVRTEAKITRDMAADAMGGMNVLFNEAAGRSREAVEAGLAAWTEETQRFYDELALQGQVALDQLQKCQSPLEVMNVEQAWMAARSKAYLESGLRFAQAFAAIAQGRRAAAGPASHPHA